MTAVMSRPSLPGATTELNPSRRCARSRDAGRARSPRCFSGPNLGSSGPQRPAGWRDTLLDSVSRRPASRRGSAPCHSTLTCHRPTASTTPATSTTRAASRWSRGSTTSRATTSSSRALDGARQPRAPRRRGRRRPHRRRRRDPHPDPRRVLPRASSTSSCPRPGRYGVGVCFLPRDPDAARASSRSCSSSTSASRASASSAGATSRSTRSTSATPPTRSRPHVKQLFIGAGPGFDDDQDAFERKLYVIRRIVELAAGPDFYAPSFSSRTLRLQGDADLHQLARLLPRPAGRALRLRAGARALAASRRTRSRAGSSRTRSA